MTLNMAALLCILAMLVADSTCARRSRRRSSSRWSRDSGDDQGFSNYDQGISGYDQGFSGYDQGSSDDDFDLSNYFEENPGATAGIVIAIVVVVVVVLVVGVSALVQKVETDADDV